ncbi:MAG: sigma-70 family RNA polymerase sigma factor [Candidatus Velthaea sp.]
MQTSASATPSADDALARAFAARVPVALEEAYRRFGGTLVAVARATLGSDDDARDCVHDALLHVWLRPEAYRIERGALRAFLIVCVRNAALDRKRNAARRFAIDRQIAQTTACDVERTAETDYVEHARLVDALAALPLEQRTVIGLAYFGECSQAQIAARLGVPLGTIKSRASLGLRRLALAMRQTQGQST